MFQVCKYRSATYIIRMLFRTIVIMKIVLYMLQHPVAHLKISIYPGLLALTV